ncbi:hypothetical protein SMGD1_1818 [Sulfurimonas gotlandica GD1]|uniref:Uncharacterized protein n=1 Tax=Sulfurimonas gotlandica (strain DSM 19862 / JCM 16533 / GD1) TaxID=929558 RepID=B6BII6_SULGG|nr:hypothetical protein [Sulfurimonas gotlandica]EDZ63269.1 hypothetical protein CBGD1_888 [Sulfurimonas gotlandica GD1]EHP30341.1 hypothetical protein SMGD1_1818 [Sulfurimonas gotlandica GD1]
MFRLFKEKEKEKIKVEIHNRLIDIRIGRKYARGEDMDGNTYECFNYTAEEVYDNSLETCDDLKAVNKSYFVEGYDLQTKELSNVIKNNWKN